MKYANASHKADDAARQLTSECLEVNKLVAPSLSWVFSISLME